MKTIHFFSVFLSACAYFRCSVLFACPLVSGLIDYNCNSRLKISIVGDSVVEGTGDIINDNKGGYVARLNQRFSNIRVVNLGTYGITVREILYRFKSGYFNKKIKKSDVVIIDAGRNDCRDNIPAIKIFRNLKRIIEFLRTNLNHPSLGYPFPVIATQIPIAPNSARAKCVNQLNSLLKNRISSQAPSYLRFDKLNSDILSGDGIHPDSRGYTKIAKKAARFILNVLQAKLLTDRTDQDQDGVYDFFEQLRFGTSSTNYDSDNDTLTDGLELFTFKTNPNLSDTDGDGTDDGAEIELGKNPLVAD